MTEQSKLALITGASRGIGAAIADCLGTSNYRVIGTATTETGAADITNHFADKRIDGYGMCLNVTDSDSLASMMTHINANHGAIDVLVNNAGITRDSLIIRMKDDDWMDVINTNLNAVFRITKACVRGMTKQLSLIHI